MNAVAIMSGRDKCMYLSRMCQIGNGLSRRSGHTTNVTEPEWSGEVVEYNVAYQGIMILSDRSIAVDIHIHDSTKQDQPPSLHRVWT